MKTGTIAERVLKLRNEYGLTQNEFALRAKLSHVAILNIESGKVKTPQRETVSAIAKTYGTTEEWVLNGEGKMLPGGAVELPLKTESKNLWEAEAYNNIKVERDTYKTELERVWAILNHITGGKIPGFLRATKEVSAPMYYLPGASFGAPSVAQG